MMAAEKVRVLVVDDDPLVRTGLRLIFRGADDLELSGEVGDGADVPDAVARLDPDVVLMDIRMPYLDGISATRALKAKPEQSPAVIVLTTFDADTNVVEALRAGAAGFLLKHTPPEQIVEAVRRAATGEPVLSPSVVRTLITRVTGSESAPDGDSPGAKARERFDLLANREQEVAIAVAKGLSNSEIAAQMYVSVGTVKAQLSSALSKLGMTNRIQLALLAHDAGKV